MRDGIPYEEAARKEIADLLASNAAEMAGVLRAKQAELETELKELRAAKAMVGEVGVQSQLETGSCGKVRRKTAV